MDSWGSVWDNIRFPFARRSAFRDLQFCFCNLLSMHMYVKLHSQLFCIFNLEFVKICSQCRASCRASRGASFPVVQVRLSYLAGRSASNHADGARRAARRIELVVKLAARRLRCPLLYPAGCRGFSWAGKPTADVRWFCVRIRRLEGKVWPSTSGKGV